MYKLIAFSLLLISLTVHAETTLPPDIPFQSVAPSANAASPPAIPPGDGGAVGVPSAPVNPSTQLSTEDTPALAEPAEIKAPAKVKASGRKRHRTRSRREAYLNPGAMPSYEQVYSDDIDSAVAGGLVVRAQPGVTEEVVIAKGKLNKIATPYANPKVLTVDSLETKVDGSSVYVATESQEPVSLFLTDEDTGSSASLQLLPQDMMRPVEITLAPGPSTGGSMNKQDAKETRLFKQDSAYIAEVKSVMQALGRQQVPDGFTLSSGDEGSGYRSVCQGPGLSFRLGQFLKSDQAQIAVYVAENHGSTSIQFEEASCASEDTVAVAAWPRFRLMPGERTEVYVLLKKPQGRSDAAPRPSLL